MLLLMMMVEGCKAGGIDLSTFGAGLGSDSSEDSKGGANAGTSVIRCKNLDPVQAREPPSSIIHPSMILTNTPQQLQNAKGRELTGRTTSARSRATTASPSSMAERSVSIAARVEAARWTVICSRVPRTERVLAGI